MGGKRIWWSVGMGIVIGALLLTTYGCSVKKESPTNKVASGIKKLVAERIDELSPEQQKAVLKGFESIPPERQKNLAQRLVNALAHQPAVQQNRPIRPEYAQRQQQNQRIMNARQRNPEMRQRFQQQMQMRRMPPEGMQQRGPQMQMRRMCPGCMCPGCMQRQGPRPQQQFGPQIERWNMPNRPGEQSPMFGEDQAREKWDGWMKKIQEQHPDFVRKIQQLPQGVKSDIASFILTITPQDIEKIKEFLRDSLERFNKQLPEQKPPKQHERKQPPRRGEMTPDDEIPFGNLPEEMEPQTDEMDTIMLRVMPEEEMSYFDSDEESDDILGEMILDTNDDLLKGMEEYPEFEIRIR